MIIYKTTNLLNGNCYVGQDANNNSRYLGSGILLNRAISKHGRENFRKEILEVCDTKEQLNQQEIYWIAKLEPIYNIAKGGSGGDTFTNNPNKEEILMKLRGRVGRPWTEEQRDAQRGDNNPAKRPESREKISKAKKGKTRPDMLGELNKAKRPDIRLKISEGLKGRAKSTIQCPHCPTTGQPSNMYRWHFDNCKAIRPI